MPAENWKCQSILWLSYSVKVLIVIIETKSMFSASSCVQFSFSKARTSQQNKEKVLEGIDLDKEHMKSSDC